MIQKKLQKGSDYNKYDLDGDGIVDDDELAAREKLHEIEAAEKQEAAELRKMTAQRRMATAVLCFMALYTLLMFMPFVTDERVKLLTDLSNLLYLTGGGIVGAYMAVSVWLKKRVRKYGERKFKKHDIRLPENIRYINPQNVELAVIKRQAFLKTKAKHGIVQVV